MTIEQSPKLDYAPQIAFFRRRRVRRSIWAVTFFLIIASAWRWGPGLYTRAARMYWQRQCMGHTLAPGQIVFDSSDGARKRWIGREGWRWEDHLEGPDRRHRYAYFMPPEWERFYEPRSKRTGPAPFKSAYLQPFATVFLHARLRPDGAERLVRLSAAQTQSDSPPGPSASRGKFWLSADVYVPMRSLTATSHSLAVSTELFGEIANQATVRIFAGQPDGSDATGFSVTLEVDGKVHPVKCHLTDSDFVDFVGAKGEITKLLDAKDDVAPSPIYAWTLTSRQ